MCLRESVITVWSVTSYLRLYINILFLCFIFKEQSVNWFLQCLESYAGLGSSLVLVNNHHEFWVVREKNPNFLTFPILLVYYHTWFRSRILPGLSLRLRDIMNYTLHKSLQVKLNTHRSSSVICVKIACRCTNLYKSSLIVFFIENIQLIYRCG